MTVRVLVTPRSLTAAGAAAPVFEPLRARGAELVMGPAGRQPVEEELLRLVPGCAYWIAGVEPIDSRILAAADQLKVISRYGSGVDAIDAEAAAQRGVTVERTAGANARGVAELALAQILGGLRGIAPAARTVAAGGWERSNGRELPDCTVGLVGLGAIGHTVAQLAGALGARVVGFDPFAGPPDDSTPVERLTRLEDVLEVSEAVSLHRPPAAGGRPVIGARELGLMRPGAVLVNTARSSLVDEAAVLAALDSGALALYAVDAFDREPPEPSPLLAHPRVVATPHLGGATGASVRRMGEMAVANVLKHLENPTKFSAALRYFAGAPSSENSAQASVFRSPSGLEGT